MNVIEKLNSIKSGEITAKENVENFIKVIDENNESINAFIELNYENALKQAEAIDEKIAKHSEISNMLLRRKISRHFYLKHLPRIINEDRNEKREHRIKNKIMKLATLIDVLDAVINQMEMQIILLE